MKYESFLALAKKRRNVRYFKPDPIPEGYVEKMIDAARWAMSGSNSQPWEFIVVKDDRLKRKIFKLYHNYELASYKLEITRDPEFRHPGRAKPPGELPRFKDAPVIIVVCADKRTMLTSVMTASIFPESHVFHMNVATAVQILHLAATSLGLASEWVSIENIEEQIKAVLAIPIEYRVYVMIPVGYPAYPLPEGTRREVNDMIHYDTFSPEKYHTDDQVLEFVKEHRKKWKVK